MSSGPKAPPPPDYTGLAKQQAGIDQEALLQQTIANRPTQIGNLGSVDWAMDPTTGRWVQKETIDPRVKAIQDEALKQQGTQMKGLSQLGSRPGFTTTPGGALFNPMDPGMTAYDPKTGEAFSKQFAQSLLARVTPQQAIDRQQTETRLRLQGLQPGTEAYNRAYQNLLTSQGDVNAQAQLQGMLAGGQESREIYNTRLNAAMQLAENQRQGYTTRMQGQNQMNTQALQQYMTPYQTAGLMQDLTAGSWGPYMPSYQGFGTAGGSPGADMMGAAQSSYAAQVQAANDRAARRAQTGSAVGTVVGAAAGTMMGGNTMAGAAAGGAIGSYFSDEALKHNIEVIDDETAYSAMLRIHPHSFSWPSGKRQSGLIAQEVAKEFPQLVNPADGGFLVVDYETFTALLLGAFRHLAKLRREDHANSHVQ